MAIDLAPSCPQTGPGQAAALYLVSANDRGGAVLPGHRRPGRHADARHRAGRRAGRAQHRRPADQGTGARPGRVQGGRHDAAADDHHGGQYGSRHRPGRRPGLDPGRGHPAPGRAAGHGPCRADRPAGRGARRVPGAGAGLARAVGTGHRGGRRARPGRLGGPRPHRRRAAHRVALQCLARLAGPATGARSGKEFSRPVSIPGLPVRSTSDGGRNGRPPEQFKEMQCGRSSRD